MPCFMHYGSFDEVTGLTMRNCKNGLVHVRPTLCECHKEQKRNMKTFLDNKMLHELKSRWLQSVQNVK